MNSNLVSLVSKKNTGGSARLDGKILLLKPPYFTPWTPPLGIAILKSFLQQQGYVVKCLDLNTDAELWGMHHKYFTAIQKLEGALINDGYSKLWWILNAHLLAYANGANRAEIEKALETIMPMYGIDYDARIAPDLLSLVEGFFKRLGKLAEEMDLADFSVVGASSYTTSLASSLFLLRIFKRKYPKIKTVMGGGIFADDLALGSENLKTLVEEYPEVDHIVLGEGEMLFLKLIEGELSHLRVISIADIGGRTLEMKNVPIPDFSDFDMRDYYHLTIEGARSCPFQCSFCSETVQWGDYRKKPIDLFAQQVVDLAQTCKHNSFFMGDSLMNPYIFQFSSALLERKADVLYDGYLRADKPVTYRDKVKLWAQSGLYRARLGIESASARVLLSMDKKTTPKTISDVLKSLAGAGIRTTTYWIVGFPGETEDDFLETCDFIREHHRQIYELEAHPYYYYPYGQIGSRLHECYSLYPEEVIKYTRFRVWEVINSQPTRLERYDRLRRISALASEVGLPNIYTMAERYQAEDRWRLLHPLAIEVYDGTTPRRNPPQPLREPLAIFSAQASAGAGSRYHCKVSRTLDLPTLSAAILEIIKFNELLQVRIENGKYVAGSASDGGRVLQVYESTEGRNEEEAAKSEFIKRVSAELEPETGNSIRVALIDGGDQSCDLFLMAHRAVADPRSVTLLCADLFRVYEQLSAGREISLRPVKKTYADFINQSGQSGSSHNRGAIQESSPARRSTGLWSELEIDRRMTNRISSRRVIDFDLKSVELLLAAFIGFFAKQKVADNFDIDLNLDQRLQDDGLELTVAPLTFRRSLPASFFADPSPSSTLRWARSAMRQTRSRVDSTDRDRILLACEYLVSEPWLGGDEWTARGFVLDTELDGTSLLEIVPVLSEGGMKVCFKSAPDDRARRLVEAAKASLTSEIESILDYSERYSAAREFWRREIGDKPSAAGLELPLQASSVEPGRRRSTLKREMNRAVLEKIGSQFDADLKVVTMAAFTALLSRLSANEEVMILCSTSDDEPPPLLPLRLAAGWNLAFADFLRVVENKIALAGAYARFGSDIWRDLLSEPGSPPLSFDAAFFYGSNAVAEGERKWNDLLDRCEKANGALKMILCLEGDGPELKIRCAYSESLAPEEIERLFSYFDSFLEGIASAPAMELGRIELDGDASHYDASDLLAGDHFNLT